MWILYIIPWLYRGGAEKLVLETCIELDKRDNITCQIVSFKSDNSFQNLSSQIKWTIIPSSVNLSIMRNNSINVTELNQFVSNFNPDIIHTHLWEAELVTRFIKYKKATWFSHFHDNVIQLKKKKFLKNKKDITNLYERNIGLTKYKELNNNFICISNDTLQYSKKELPKYFHNKIYLLHNAINVVKFKTTKPKPKDKIRMIMVGSLFPKKNQQFGIQILKNLIDLKYDAELTLLGDGPNKELLIMLAKKLGVEKKVKLKGNVQNVNEHLWSNNIYLHTAYYEPFGLAILEAMASKLPVVSLDGKGNRDFIINDKNGYILSSENTNEFAQTIINLYNNPELYTKIASKGYETACKYDIQTYADNLLTIYRDAMSSTNAE